MQALLGLIVFSILLARGASLQCELCTHVGTSPCTGPKQQCPGNADVCVTMVAELGSVVTNSKVCGVKAECEKLKTQIGKAGPTGSTLTKIECNKAPPKVASLLLAFSGFLIMKMLL